MFYWNEECWFSIPSTIDRPVYKNIILCWLIVNLHLMTWHIFPANKQPSDLWMKKVLITFLSNILSWSYFLFLSVFLTGFRLRRFNLFSLGATYYVFVPKTKQFYLQTLRDIFWLQLELNVSTKYLVRLTLKFKTNFFFWPFFK
jgi:hypothetical protein